MSFVQGRWLVRHPLCVNERQSLAKTHEAQSLSGVLQAMGDAGEGDRVSVGELSEALESRSFGPLLLVPSLILISPLSGIPGVPTLGAIIIILVAVQMAFRNRRLWLPDVIRNRAIQRTKLRSVAERIKPFAVVIERFVGRRLTFLTRPPFDLLLIIPCVVFALAMPPLEFVPMSATILASAIFFLSLALTMRDGILALLTLTIAAGAVALGLKVVF